MEAKSLWVWGLVCSEIGVKALQVAYPRRGRPHLGSLSRFVVNHLDSTSLADVADDTRWEGRSSMRCSGIQGFRVQVCTRTLPPGLPPSPDLENKI